MSMQERPQDMPGQLWAQKGKSNLVSYRCELRHSDASNTETLALNFLPFYFLDEPNGLQAQDCGPDLRDVCVPIAGPEEIRAAETGRGKWRREKPRDRERVKTAEHLPGHTPSGADLWRWTEVGSTQPHT
jgi:hypothetical protein